MAGDTNTTHYIYSLLMWIKNQTKRERDRKGGDRQTCAAERKGEK